MEYSISFATSGCLSLEEFQPSNFLIRFSNLALAYLMTPPPTTTHTNIDTHSHPCDRTPLHRNLGLKARVNNVDVT